MCESLSSLYLFPLGLQGPCENDQPASFVSFLLPGWKPHLGLGLSCGDNVSWGGFQIGNKDGSSQPSRELSQPLQKPSHSFFFWLSSWHFRADYELGNYLLTLYTRNSRARIVSWLPVGGSVDGWNQEMPRLEPGPRVLSVLTLRPLL